MDLETKIKRSDYIQALPKGEPISIYTIINTNLFPPSASHSAYWTGTGPGSRIAYELGLRVEFSNKLLTITFYELSTEEFNMRTIQFKRCLERSKDRNAKYKEQLAKLLGEL